MRGWVQLVCQILFRHVAFLITQANNSVLKQGLNVAHSMHGSTKVSTVVDEGVARAPALGKMR